MDNLGENHFLTTNGLNFGLYSSFSLEIYLFVGFFRFRKELGRTAATPNTTNSFPKEFSPPGKEQKPNTNPFATAPRVSVLLRCTVTGCSWFPDLVCCSNKLFSTKRPKLRPAIYRKSRSGGSIRCSRDPQTAPKRVDQVSSCLLVVIGGVWGPGGPQSSATSPWRRHLLILPSKSNPLRPVSR